MGAAIPGLLLKTLVCVSKQAPDSLPATTMLAWGRLHHPPARNEIGYTTCLPVTERNPTILGHAHSPVLRPSPRNKERPHVQPFNVFTLAEAK